MATERVPGASRMATSVDESKRLLDGSAPSRQSAVRHDGLTQVGSTGCQLGPLYGGVRWVPWGPTCVTPHGAVGDEAAVLVEAKGEAGHEDHDLEDIPILRGSSMGFVNGIRQRDSSTGFVNGVRQ